MEDPELSKSCVQRRTVDPAHQPPRAHQACKRTVLARVAPPHLCSVHPRVRDAADVVQLSGTAGETFIVLVTRYVPDCGSFLSGSVHTSCQEHAIRLMMMMTHHERAGGYDIRMELYLQAPSAMRGLLLRVQVQY